MSNTCKIKNRSAGICVYKVPELGVRRSFAPGEIKEIPTEELEKLTYQPGGLSILSNFLQILSEEEVKKIGIHTEPEYYMSEADVANLLKNGSLDEFLDCLDFAPPGVIDIIRRLSVSMPLTDIAKKDALLKKIGFDVDAAFKHEREDKEGQEAEAEVPKRRVVKPEAEEGRRTAAPKYNVVNIKEDK